MRNRYRFVGRVGNRYVWQAVRPAPGDSRVMEVSCYAPWFWGQTPWDAS